MASLTQLMAYVQLNMAGLDLTLHVHRLLSQQEGPRSQ